MRKPHKPRYLPLRAIRPPVPGQRSSLLQVIHKSQEVISIHRIIVRMIQATDLERCEEFEDGTDAVHKLCTAVKHGRLHSMQVLMTSGHTAHLLTRVAEMSNWHLSHGGRTQPVGESSIPVAFIALESLLRHGTHQVSSLARCGKVVFDRDTFELTLSLRVPPTIWSEAATGPKAEMELLVRPSTRPLDG